MKPAAHRARARELEDLDRRGQPLDGRGAACRHLHEALGEGERVRRQQDRPRSGHLLHPRGQVRGVTDRRVVHVEVRADGADHDVARVQAHADLDRDPVTVKHLLRVALHRFLHSQGRIAGAHRVILVRERRPEKGHDPVAHHLVHRAPVAVDGLHHVVEHRIE